ncbi:hypothetical protein [uncultured Pseudokineococcus sp.]|uniref:hypothetical protein n=1 Tax=uncultured Pseudokineococcus sp. TaxID=1642928 RepID=UPI0026174044|nr:hypothetical protein [uncultured Pseudokineococcus sp.]
MDGPAGPDGPAPPPDGPAPPPDGPAPPPDGDGAQPDPPEPADAVPPAGGRARDLVRGRRRAPRTPDPAGRAHHMGSVPDRMPVLRPDGSRGTTRTSVVQLTAATPHRLEQLEVELEAEMRGLAAEGRYEEAAWARDELAATRGEVERRRERGRSRD